MMWYIRLFVLACVVCAAVVQDGRAEESARGAPSVAVLVEPGFPMFGGIPALIPAVIVPLLEKHGVKARPFSVAELEMAGRLDPVQYPVLVMPYGNAFPQPVFEILRGYHAAGGCLVLTGVPFCHPCERKDGKWVDMGSSGRFHHGAGGIGTGGFAGAKEGLLAVQHHGFQPNPLGLTQDLPFPRKPLMRQWLNASTLAAVDEVIPLIGLVCQGEDGGRPVSAIIRHRCAEFNGAIDVWIGQAASGPDADDAFVAGQLLVRASAWCLREKGLMAAAAVDALFKRLDQEGKPQPMPTGLAAAAEPRPWGDTFLPKSKPPARRLLAVDLRKLKTEQRVALACLQGLTSRNQPVIWLLSHEPFRFWLDLHVARGHIDGYDVVDDWKSLFKRFAGAYKGAVIPDAALYRGDLLAVNIAACEDLIVATPELAAELGIPVRQDLRKRFGSYADGLAWVWSTHGRSFSRHLCNYLHPARLANGAFAYDLQWRGMMFWPAGAEDALLPGADMHREKLLIARILSELAPNTAILGFPYGGEGVGLGEVTGVALASRYAKALVCNDNLANLSVMSGVQVLALAQARAQSVPPLEKDKIYVAMALSDGDNQNCWLGFYKRFFDHARLGEFPLAFGMGPPIIDLMPAVAQWYYEKGGSNVEFFADVSGIGYIQPDNFAVAFADREAVFRGFLDWTGKYLDRMGMGTVRTVGGGDDLLQRYSVALPSLHSLFADMGRYSGREGITNLTYVLPGGGQVFRAVTSWRFGTNSFPREISEQVGGVRPAFVNAFLHCWTYNSMDQVCRLYDGRCQDMVFVTPHQLAVLYRQAREKGWAR